MATRFTCPVLIQRNTREIRDRLRTLGYDVGYIEECPDNYGWATGEGFAVVLRPDQFDYWTSSVPGANRVNCGTNEELFFALAALRNDTDRYQWFTNGVDWGVCPGRPTPSLPGFGNSHTGGLMFFGEVTNIARETYHKASADEIMEHFK